jgi:hypothetical protein
MGLIRLSATISPRLSRAKPACASRKLQRRPSRPSAIGYDQPSAIQGEARLRVTQTPTATLSTIGYRLRSALGYLGRSPPARHANSNGDPLDHRLSAIGYRLSAIGSTGQSPSAHNTNSNSNGDPLDHRLSATISPRLSRAKPACASRKLQRRPSRPSAIGYRLSAIDYTAACGRGARTCGDAYCSIYTRNIPRMTIRCPGRNGHSRFDITAPA